MPMSASFKDRLFVEFKDRNGYAPRLYMESGRYITGPHGVLITRAINRKDIYRTYVGVDASIELIRREERAEDYFATLNFESDTIIPAKQLIRAA